MSPKYWLLKSEPGTYSIDSLAKDGSTWWEGVRNYQARNFMQAMSPGDFILFYHSSAEPTGVAGVGKIAAAAAPDQTQFKKSSSGFDPKASKEKPIWFCPEVVFEKKFKKFVTLEDLRQIPALKDMLVLKRGQRLSVQPVSEKEFQTVIKMGQ